jgi:hypothetical protein
LAHALLEVTELGGQGSFPLGFVPESVDVGATTIARHHVVASQISELNQLYHGPSDEAAMSLIFLGFVPLCHGQAMHEAS